MKKRVLYLLSVVLLLSAVGCSHTSERPLPGSASSLGLETVLGVTDLNNILATIDLTDAALTYCGDEEGTYPANAAIYAESYMEKLKSFIWEEYVPESGWAENERHYRYSYQLTAPGVTITVFQSGDRPIHLITDQGAGWFVLPYIEAWQGTEQLTWMVYDVFESWYAGTEAASCYGGGGTPLTATELDWFRKYTESTWSSYDAEWGGHIIGATEISCFFTSLYDTVTALDFKEFMQYFPDDTNESSAVTDAEFESLKKVDSWPFKETKDIDSMPVPIHKYPRSTVDAVLTKYAGITTADLDTSGVIYLSEYDAWYGGASDFGPGTFTPCYGEKNGDIVTLWSTSTDGGRSTSMLILQKSGEEWRILSHNAVMEQTKS